MSDKKQVIHVKDLVIQADHVYIERGKREHDHRPKHRHESNESRESSNERHHHHESKDGERESRRGPFDWF